MESIIKLVSDNGLSIIINAMFLYVIYHYYQNLNPRLGNIEQGVKEKNITAEKTQALAEASTKAIESLAHSNDNVAQAIDALNITMQGQKELMLLLHEDTRESQARLYAHDDRAEKIYTMLHKMYVDKYGRIDP